MKVSAQCKPVLNHVCILLWQDEKLKCGVYTTRSVYTHIYTHVLMLNLGQNTQFKSLTLYKGKCIFLLCICASNLSPAATPEWLRQEWNLAVGSSRLQPAGFMGFTAELMGSAEECKGCLEVAALFFPFSLLFFFLHASLPFLLEVIKYLKELFVLEGRLRLCELGLL